MRFYKIINNGYLIAVGNGSGGTEITEAEYNNLLSVIHNKPTTPEGYDYRLREDSTWELYELPEPEPEDEEATTEDYEAALSEVGV